MNNQFCIYIKDEKEHYTIKIRTPDRVLTFNSKEEAQQYADSIGLKQYCVKYSDWKFGE